MLNPGHVPGQVFIKNRLKEVNYEKYKSISILYPIDYQKKEKVWNTARNPHNQGVPGSCPGGPTAERQDFQGFMLSKA